MMLLPGNNPKNDILSLSPLFPAVDFSKKSVMQYVLTVSSFCVLKIYGE